MSRGMIEMNQAAIDALADQAFAEGKVEGVRQAEDEHEDMRLQFKRVRELLEVEGDQSLVEACEHLFNTLKAYRESHGALQSEVAAVKRYAKEVSDAFEPAQKKIFELNQIVVAQRKTIEELRQALLAVKENQK